MWDRLEALIGEKSVKELSKKTILIVGLGGVGSYALESLARSGVGKFIIVDYDKVDITNINRQLYALNSTIGVAKVDIAEKRIKDINPKCKIKKYECKFSIETKDDICNEDIDFIVDCCDDIEAKKQLIREAIKRDIDIISCMGMAKKLDPKKIEICELSKTYNDPLAKILRKFIKDEKINKKIMVAFSSELPLKTKQLASNAFVPSSAGLIIGHYVVSKLIK